MCVASGMPYQLNACTACLQDVTDFVILVFKQVEGSAELQVARHCMSEMRALKEGSSMLCLHSFMPVVSCEVAGSELQ